MYLHVWLVSSSKCKFLAGSKFVPIRKDLNLLLLPRFWIPFTSYLLLFVWFDADTLCFIFAERFNGKLKLRRGFVIPKNSSVLIVEDVITTGKSALECSKIIKMNNSKLIGYACIIDRSNKEILIKDKIVSQIKFEISTFKENELPKYLKKIKPVKPGSRNIP